MISDKRSHVGTRDRLFTCVVSQDTSDVRNFVWFGSADGSIQHMGSSLLPPLHDKVMSEKALMQVLVCHKIMSGRTFSWQRNCADRKEVAVL